MAVAAALADVAVAVVVVAGVVVVVVGAGAVVVVVVVAFGVVLVDSGALGSWPTAPRILPCQLPFCQSEGGHRNSLQK